MFVGGDCIKNMYISSLYINAGRTIMDALFRKNCKYTDHVSLNRYYDVISNASSDFLLAVEDCYFAFCDTLCRKLSERLFCNEETYIILSPYHSADVCYQLIIPSKNIIVYNTFPFNICENDKLYITLSDKTDTERLTYAIDFFNKSIIKQQE